MKLSVKIGVGAKVFCIAFALLSLSFAVFADGMATMAFVFERSDFDKMLKSSGEVAKIPSEKLSASIASASIGRPQNAIRIDFDYAGVSYSLLAGCKDGVVLYSIFELSKAGRSKLVVSGLVEEGKQVKAELGLDPFVLIARTGNFLKK